MQDVLITLSVGPRFYKGRKLSDYERRSATYKRTTRIRFFVGEGRDMSVPDLVKTATEKALERAFMYDDPADIKVDGVNIRPKDEPCAPSAWAA